MDNNCVILQKEAIAKTKKYNGLIILETEIIPQDN